MREGELEEFNLNLQKKYAKIRDSEQRYESLFLEDAKVVLVAYGTMARIAKGAVYNLREKGKDIGLIRPITLWPFPEKPFKFLLRKKRRTKILVIEMSYGQMIDDVRLALGCKLTVEFLGRAGGGIPTEEEIIKKINRLL